MADKSWPLPWLEVAGDKGGALKWLEYALYRAFVGVGSHLPTPGRKLMSLTLGTLARALDRRRSRAAAEFIAQAYPDLPPERRHALVLAAWRHLIELVLEDARFNALVAGPDIQSHFEIELSERAKAMVTSGRGGLVVVPHVGMWEALPAISPSLGFHPAYVVSRPPRNRFLARHAQRTREERGYRLIPRHGAIEHLMAAVEGGGFVGLMLDQRARGKTVVAPFFGRPANCERSIAVLVRRLKRPVLFAACYRTAQPYRYKAVFDTVIEPEEFSRSSPEEIAARLNVEMERLIRRAPEQYFWLHDRYRKAPLAGDGEGS